MRLAQPDFESLFLSDTHWIDVRSPIEFFAGKIPGAVNRPLLTDDERHDIGLTFRQQGQDAAIELGHKRVSGDVKETRVRLWLDELEVYPQSVVYCFRGGLRSQVVQTWLKDRGIERPIIEGGYKALRRYLIDALERCAHEMHFHVVSGPTGSGKTDYLHSSGRPFVDLEAIASHRGSAFGANGTQPNQVDFENMLALKLMRLQKIGEAVLIEDESLRIGQCAIPKNLYQKMQSSPKIQIEIDFDVRIENIFRDYVLNSKLGLRGDPEQFQDFRRSVHAISRKLGGLRTQEILNDLAFSQGEFAAGHGLDSNRVWIGKLMRWYYDPLYIRALA